MKVWILFIFLYLYLYLYHEVSKSYDKPKELYDMILHKEEGCGAIYSSVAPS